eukprot:CAMPEP_0114627266 /NCGR_PEP_ID=MMETSP0168-20121206/12209_1 /TAXON_ID=95228 ORGANISM="Vannella sp., Strain DIVA3 517/6/12" /NCGR_SAMPLE_ID=MMETSP0168 /ASSEMBLY_ACC=CAM_ASM_000044 /LENGTH=453 /DNA_ID=CAMNT_0001838597 /DNA_START=226 /DNA_END=1587 /DNA_ORIENTATION=+
MKKWEVPNRHKPFAKNVVCLLGTTSSGKSALVNHFFKTGVKKVAVFQLDTHFTIIETVPEAEFRRIVGQQHYQPRAMDDATLDAPVEDHFSDSRRNVVYAVLDTASTIARHEQFENFSSVFRKHELINAVLINERYLRGSEQDKRRMRNTIFIDSPGFTAESDLVKLKGNLEVLQYLYTLADLTLFCIPSDSINLVSSQVAMLELSILYAVHGENHFTKALDALLSAPENNGGGGLFSFGISDLFNVISRKLRSVSDEQPTAYDGSVYWDKVKFVLTKIDRCNSACKCGQVRPEAQYFELGTMLGKNLRFLKAPVFDQCFAVALPEQQLQLYRQQEQERRGDRGRDRAGDRGGDNGGKGEEEEMYRRTADGEYVPHRLVTGDLSRLIEAVGALNFYDSFVVRLDAAIQLMCEELRAKIKGSWSYAALLARSHMQLVNTIHANSCRRSRARPSQ